MTPKNKATDRHIKRILSRCIKLYRPEHPNRRAIVDFIRMVWYVTKTSHGSGSTKALEIHLGSVDYHAIEKVLQTGSSAGEFAYAVGKIRGGDWIRVFRDWVERVFVTREPSCITVFSKSKSNTQALSIDFYYCRNCGRQGDIQDLPPVKSIKQVPLSPGAHRTHLVLMPWVERSSVLHRHC